MQDRKNSMSVINILQSILEVTILKEDGDRTGVVFLSMFLSFYDYTSATVSKQQFYLKFLEYERRQGRLPFEKIFVFLA